MAKKKDLMGMAKGTMGFGIMSGASLGAMGAMGSVPGMPAEYGNVVKTTGAGLNIAGIANLGSIGMSMPEVMGMEKKKKGKGCKKCGSW